MTGSDVIRRAARTQVESNHARSARPADEQVAATLGEDPDEPSDRSVEVRFIGTGGPFADGARLQSATLITAAGTRVLVDCGATTLVGLHRDGIDTASIDVIVLTHLHGDHFGALPFLLADVIFAPSERAQRRARPTVGDRWPKPHRGADPRRHARAWLSLRAAALGGQRPGVPSQVRDLFRGDQL